ncbi:hypothetical protein [Yinghuangia sp. YIM S09857]
MDQASADRRGSVGGAMRLSRTLATAVPSWFGGAANAPADAYG